MRGGVHLLLRGRMTAYPAKQEEGRNAEDYHKEQDKKECGVIAATIVARVVRSLEWTHGTVMREAALKGIL